MKRPEYIDKNWVSDKTWEFISNLSFDGYYLAGNSVANMIAKIPLQGDLDFWIDEGYNYSNALNEFLPYYDTFEMYPSMIEMKDTTGTYPRINLVYTMQTISKTISRFDFDYCRCYWSPKEKIVADEECTPCITNKIIQFPSETYFGLNENTENTFTKRMKKAFKYGYKFTKDFWKQRKDLLKNPTTADLSQITEEDVCLKKLKEPDEFKISDKNDISKTLVELSIQYKRKLQQNAMLTALLKFDKSEFDLLRQYLEVIVFRNPLKNANYLELVLGTNLIHCHGNDDSYVEINDENFNDKASSNDNEDDDSAWDEDEDSLSEEACKKAPRKNQSQDDESNDESCNFDSATYDLIDLKTKFETKINLTKDGSSYLLISYLPKELIKHIEDNFYDMWNLHPERKHKIIMYEKEVEVNRYSKSYLHTSNDLSHITTKSYMYSGYETDNNNGDLPKVFKPLHQYMAKQDAKYNQAIVNWYENEKDYIGFHSDCQKNMIDNAKISIISMYQNSEHYRCLKLRPKNDLSLNNYKIMLNQGMILTMCGNTQNDYRHGITKELIDTERRISLSFRQMK